MFCRRIELLIRVMVRYYVRDIACQSPAVKNGLGLVTLNWGMQLDMVSVSLLAYTSNGLMGCSLDSDGVSIHNHTTLNPGKYGC